MIGGLLAGCLGLAGCGGEAPQASRYQRIQSDVPVQQVQAMVEAGRAGDRRAVPLLIDRLEDDDADVRMVAAETLRRITGESKGYRFYADRAERTEAVQRWREWLAEQTPSTFQASTLPAGG